MARLAQILLSNLSDPGENETEEIWAEEAECRYHEIWEICRGDVEGVRDSDEAFREIRVRRK
jgi:hypothetical protein